MLKATIAPHTSLCLLRCPADMQELYTVDLYAWSVRCIAGLLGILTRYAINGCLSFGGVANDEVGC